VGVGEDIVKVILIRAHGILMIIAWPILAVTAIFFAAWMNSKPALPNGEWFQVSNLSTVHAYSLPHSLWVVHTVRLLSTPVTRTSLPSLPHQVHRAFMMVSLFIAALGFVLIFVAFQDSRGLITLGSDNVSYDATIPAKPPQSCTAVGSECITVGRLRRSLW